MTCHYDHELLSNLEQKQLQHLSISFENKVVIIDYQLFNVNPIINEMIYGYSWMASLNQQIVDEYSACQYDTIEKLIQDFEDGKLNDEDMKGWTL